MKKLICLLLAVTMLASLAACSADNNNGKTENSQSTAENTEQSTSAEEAPTNDDTSSKVKTARTPGTEIYVDYDVSLRKKEQPTTILMYNNNDCLTGLCFQVNEEYTGTLEGVIDVYKEDFIIDATTSSCGDLYGSEIEVISTEKVTVAGRDSIKFIGTVNNDNKWDCHVYGYTFIINNKAYALIGLVSAKEQDSEMIKEIDERIDKMAATIRTTK